MKSRANLTSRDSAATKQATAPTIALGRRVANFIPAGALLAQIAEKVKPC